MLEKTYPQNCVTERQTKKVQKDLEEGRHYMIQINTPTDILLVLNMPLLVVSLILLR
jgi:hypothetical protein